MRIREGDPLEIYTERDGSVIFKKYSLLGGLTEFATQMCETLNRTTGRIAVITTGTTLLLWPVHPGGSCWTSRLPLSWSG